MAGQTLAAVSDGLVVATLIGYVAAMVAYAVEIATRSAIRPARCGAGRATVPAALTAVAVRPEAAPAGPATAATALAVTGGRTQRAARWAGPAAVAITAAAAVTHAGSLLARGVAAERVPLGNMYEFVLAVGLAGVVGWLVVLARRPVRELGLFVTLTLALLVGVAARLYTRVAPLVPALDSPWLRIHVGTAALASGLLLIGFVAAALYVTRLHHDAALRAGRRTVPSGTIGRLPAPEVLERLALRMHQVAFPVWTFAIVAGAIWAEAAWGRYWGWDPKETWAFVSWVLYASYLHARSTAGWRGRPAALVAMVAWASMLVNLFVVNLVFTGLHSYAGL